MGDTKGIAIFDALLETQLLLRSKQRRRATERSLRYRRQAMHARKDAEHCLELAREDSRDYLARIRVWTDRTRAAESRALAAESERDTLRSALRGADEEIARLREALKLALENGEFEHVSNCAIWTGDGFGCGPCDCYVGKVRAALASRLTVEEQPTITPPTCPHEVFGSCSRCPPQPTRGTPGPLALAALERCRERLAADGVRAEELGAAAECRVCHAPQPGPHKMSCRPRDRERMAQPTHIGDGDKERTFLLAHAAEAERLAIGADLLTQTSMQAHAEDLRRQAAELPTRIGDGEEG